MKKRGFMFHHFMQDALNGWAAPLPLPRTRETKRLEKARLEWAGR